jgi:hypothetical protein
MGGGVLPVWLLMAYWQHILAFSIGIALLGWGIVLPAGLTLVLLFLVVQMLQVFGELYEAHRQFLLLLPVLFLFLADDWVSMALLSIPRLLPLRVDDSHWLF